MIQTRYSKLKTKESHQDSETYKGIWNHTSCEFKRDFRGHRLTDEECAGLCRGEKIEIHNLKNKFASVYAVACKLNLKENMFGELVTMIEVLDTVPNNSNHKYGDALYNANPYKVAVNISNDSDDDFILDLNDDDLIGINTEDEVIKYQTSMSSDINSNREKIHHENLSLKNMLKNMTSLKNQNSFNDNQADNQDKTDISKLSDNSNDSNEFNDYNSYDEYDDEYMDDSDRISDTESNTVREYKLPENLSYNADTDSF
jgi:hypothetical protein